MSTNVDNKVIFTSEDLLSLPDGNRYELVDGRLVGRNVSAESSRVEETAR